MYYNNITGRATLILLSTIALLAILGVLGTFLQWVWGVDGDLIREAMRIIGLSGPGGAAIQSTADVVREIKRPGSATQDSPLPPKSEEKPESGPPYV